MAEISAWSLPPCFLEKMSIKIGDDYYERPEEFYDHVDNFGKYGRIIYFPKENPKLVLKIFSLKCKTTEELSLRWASRCSVTVSQYFAQLYEDYTIIDCKGKQLNSSLFKSRMHHDGLDVILQSYVGESIAKIGIRPVFLEWFFGIIYHLRNMADVFASKLLFPFDFHCGNITFSREENRIYLIDPSAIVTVSKEKVWSLIEDVVNDMLYLRNELAPNESDETLEMVRKVFRGHIPSDQLLVRKDVEEEVVKPKETPKRPAKTPKVQPKKVQKVSPSQPSQVSESVVEEEDIETQEDKNWTGVDTEQKKENQGSLAPTPQPIVKEIVKKDPIVELAALIRPINSDMFCFEKINYTRLEVTMAQGNFQPLIVTLQDVFDTLDDMTEFATNFNDLNFYVVSDLLCYDAHKRDEVMAMLWKHGKKRRKKDAPFDLNNKDVLKTVEKYIKMGELLYWLNGGLELKFYLTKGQNKRIDAATAISGLREAFRIGKGPDPRPMVLKYLKAWDSTFETKLLPAPQ